MAVIRRIGMVVVAVLGVLACAPPPGAVAHPRCYCPASLPIISVSASRVAQGGNLVIEGIQFTPTGQAELSLHSAPVELGRLTVDGKGRFTAEVTVPASVAPGRHTIMGLDLATGDFATAEITVLRAVGQPGSGPPGGGLAGTGVAVAGLLAFGLVLLIGGKVLTAIGRRRDVRV